MSNRLPRPAAPAWSLPWLASFELHLKSRGRAQKTRDMYLGSTRWLAGWLAQEHPDVDDFEFVTHVHLQQFWVFLEETAGCAQSGRNATARSIQQFWRWWAEEEDAPNPMLKAPPPSAPRAGDKLVPVIAEEQMAALIADAEKRKDFEGRRDAAMIRTFGASGGRISELVVNVDAVDLDKRRIRVVGKAGKERWAPIGPKAAVAIDRYLRLRAKHKLAHRPACDRKDCVRGCGPLWLGIRRIDKGLTTWGIRQALQRRAERLEIRLWPHMFRHTFCSDWLDNGGNESDLVELVGWEGPQMLKTYGRAARGRRAARAYDRVMGEAV